MKSAASLENNNTGASATQVFMFPASFGQRRLWFLSQLYPDSAWYNMPAMIRIKGPLDVQALHKSLREIVRRHESLRTRFTDVDGEPRQVIELTVNLELPLITVKSDDVEREARRLAQQVAEKPFAMSQGPLLRTTLLKLAEQDHVLVLVMHHIISDGWSMAVLVREASILYAAYSSGKPSPLPELPIQYVDFSEWQRERLTGQILEQQLAYWKQQLAGIEMLELPVDKPYPKTLTQEGDTVAFTLPPDQARRAKEICQQEGITLYVLLLAAFQVLLHRYSSQQDIAVGSPSAGRARPETEDLIGFFVNTLVIRTNLSGNLTFREVLKQVHETILQAHAHQDLPFERLVDEQADRSSGRTPFFQVMFVLQNLPAASLELGVTKLERFNFDLHTAKFELTLTLVESQASVGMRGWLEYNTSLFREETVLRMVEHYERLLSSALSGPDQPIGELDLLTEEEREQFLSESSAMHTVHPQLCIHRVFEEQVGRTPTAIAVQYETQELVYQELNRRANQLAHHLKSLGAGPETLVGICMERCAEMAVAILAVLKSDAAYVPLDATYPPERINYMLEDAQIRILINHHATESKLPSVNIVVVNLDLDQDKINANSGNNPQSLATPLNAAYVIYTSGSTGRPKGVIVTHSNVIRLFTATQNWFDFGVHDVWTLFHSYAFDFSVWELWGALLFGGRVVIVPYWVSRSPEAFYNLLKNQGVTVLNQTPSAFKQLSQFEEETKIGPSGLDLRVVVFGGEALEMSSLRPWFARHGYERPRLINMYGITETTVHVTYQPIDEQIAGGNASLIGRPIPDLQLYVLNSNLQLAPAGGVGELYVGGMGLARGYLNRPELTAQRFIPHPFSAAQGERLYRTGDAVRRRADGRLEYLGRTDQQIKIRGHRIELGEIESALRGCAGVAQVAVVVREEVPGDKRLVAYLVPDQECAAPVRKFLEMEREGKLKEELHAPEMISSPDLWIADLRASLKHILPDYMVPSAFVPLERLPLTANGKIDQRALLSINSRRSEREQNYVAPRTAVEEALAKIWENLLKVERVSIHDNFFELGGHSLLAVRLRTAIQKTFSRDVPLVTLFNKSTVAQVAQLLEQSHDRSATEIMVCIQPQGQGAPFFCVHPVGGNVLCYADLAREMGNDRPFYAFQSPVPDPQTRNFLAIEEMAALYIAELRKVQSAGPYLLGGWSMGGLVAYEMARQLTAQGESIELITMIDSYPPTPERRLNTPMLARFAGDLGRVLGKDLRRMASQFLELGPDEQWNLLLKTLVQEDVLPPETAQQELTNMLNVFTQNSLAIENYALQQSPQRIVLFRAAEAENSERLAEEWAHWASSVELHLIHGDHYTMIQQPRVSQLAQLLRTRLEQLETIQSR